MVEKVESREPIPPELSDAYHRGRRSYGFFSGLLIAWELIGVEIKEAPFKDFDVVLKSPQAAPYVLIALVLYFAFRTTIEWNQCHPERRVLPASRVDFSAAHTLGAGAIVLYGLQRLLEIRVAEFFGQDDILLSVFGSFAGIILSVFVLYKISKRKRGIGDLNFIKNEVIYVLLLLFPFIFTFLVFSGAFMFFEGFTAKIFYFVLASLVGAAIPFATVKGLAFLRRRLRQKIDVD